MTSDNGLPYYRAFPRDFIEGTVGMPFELKGAYRVLLDLIYMRRGRLVDDPRYIAGVLGCSVRKWTSLRDQLVGAGKIAIIDGFIRNHRADIEVENQRKLAAKQRENARGSRKIKDLEKPRLGHTESEPESEDSWRDRPPPPARPPGPEVVSAENETGSGPPALREAILAACGADPVSGLTGPNGTVLGTRADMLAVERWRSDLGLDDRTILAVVRDAMARKRDGPPSRLTYFDRPMQREAGARHQPKLEPIDAHFDQSLPARLGAGSGTDRRPTGLVGVALRRAAARCGEVAGEI